MFRLNSNFLNRLVKKIPVLVFSLALVIMSTASAFAYTTEAFDVDVVVAENNSYEVSETVKVNFDKQQHGIYVYIPESGIEGIDLPDFRYRRTIIDDRDTTKDFMYLDLLPTGWETAIKSTTIHVTMPKVVDSSKIQVYADTYGSNDMVSNVSWDCDETGQNITITGKNLAKGQGITIFAELPEGYWQDQLNYDSVLTLIPIICIVLAAVLLALWMIFGRDKGIIPTVEFYPPAGLTPAEVGLIADGTLDKGDLVSLIIYFADKGYLTIEQTGKKKFAFRKANDIV